MSSMPVDFSNCNHNFIWDGVCECLEKRQCGYAYSYGGDVFCKHPFTSQEGKQSAQGQMAFEYAGIFDSM